MPVGFQSSVFFLLFKIGQYTGGNVDTLFLTDYLSLAPHIISVAEKCINQSKRCLEKKICLKKVEC